MKSVKGRLYYHILVTCPFCEEVFDITEEDLQDQDGCITDPLFTNNWGACKDETHCPTCECVFIMEGVE